MSDFPKTIVRVGHVEPVPRRIRAMTADGIALDSTRALYRWDIPYYPQFYIPVTDIVPELIDREGVTLHDHLLPGSDEQYAHIDWDLVDAWFEEDERVFVHPRNPYTRVDAIRSRRSVTVSLDGARLATADALVMVFETGLPTRYYFDPTAVDWTHLIESDTVTECPYKGTTTGYWSVKLGDQVHDDLAWSYAFPTRQLLPIAGLIAFYNEKVDIRVDGRDIERPVTKFS